MKNHKRLEHLATAVLGIGALGLLVQTAQADLLSQDGFNYTANSTLYGNGTWVNGQTDPGITVGSGSLSYSGLVNLPGNGASVAIGNTTSTYLTAAGFSSKTSGTIFASFLFDVTSLVTGYNQNSTLIGLLPTGGSYSSTTDPCDIPIKTNGDGINYGLGIRTGSGSGTSYTGLTLLQVNTVYLIVTEYNYTGHSATLWINPSSSTFGASSAPAYNVTSTGGTAPGDVSEFYLRQAPYVSGTSPADPAPPYTVDDVRVGTTWADVTPATVPEPSSLTLIGLGALGLALWRRMLSGPAK